MSVQLKVTRGRTLNGERVTEAILNQMALPTVELEEQAVLDIIATQQSGLSVYAPKNVLINPSFDIWQRGTVFDENVEGGGVIYTADRWLTNAHNSTRTIRLMHFPSVPGLPKYYLRWEQDGAADVASTALVQCVEDVRTLSGGKATLSAWVRPSVEMELTLQLSQHFGIGGAPSPGVVLGGVVKAIVPGAFHRISATFDVPSISGKILGTDTNHGNWLNAQIFVPQDTIFTLDFANVQLEAGEFATAFERRDVATEMVRCQRYFEMVQCQLASAFTDIKPMMFYKVTKRIGVNPGTVDIVGDAATPYAQYFSYAGLGSAQQITTHAQALGTFSVDAELYP